QVHEDANDRQDNHADQPAGLGPATEVIAAEDVHDDPEHQHEPQDPAEEVHHRQEYVHERISGHFARTPPSLTNDTTRTIAGSKLSILPRTRPRLTLPG